MKLVVLSIVLSITLSSCGLDTKSLGGNYVLYRDQGSMQFTAIGLNLSFGGTQGLIDGRILKYGYNDRYVVVMLENEQFFYFDKTAVYNYFEKPARVGEQHDKNPVIGPIGTSEFKRATNELGLPLLNKEIQ